MGVHVLAAMRGSAAQCMREPVCGTVADPGVEVTSQDDVSPPLGVVSDVASQGVQRALVQLLCSRPAAMAW